MSNDIVVHRGRVKTIQIETNEDLLLYDVFSDIRVGTSKDTDLIASWTVSKLTDGSDGLLVLSLSSSITEDITQNYGYMDLKKVYDGKSYSIFKYPLKVMFYNIVTV